MKKIYFEPYSAEVEKQMLKYYKSLNEKGQREYAALESLRLPFGGKAYIIGLLGISFNRLARGIKELLDDKVVKAEKGRIRLPGGGRKKKSQVS